MIYASQKITNAFRITLMLAVFASLVSCHKAVTPEASLAFESVIPKPVSAVQSGYIFALKKEAMVVTNSEDKEITAIGQYLANRLKPATGFDLPVSVSTTASTSNAIYLTTAGGDASWGDEGYELTITEDIVKIVANKPAGLFYGIQTLMQVMPDKIEQSSMQNGPWEIATGTILDHPEYTWRGSMLDVARHFFSVEDVKRYIDLMSYYKLNMFHLSLTNDQGWRIEIKSWPNLANHGGTTQVGGGKGGFYTQEQYKDIVAYALSRYITVVPEIDMPGHTNAALASYGELNGGTIVPAEGRIELNKKDQVLGSKTKPTELYTGIEVGFSTLRVEKPETFKFVNDVIRELSEITPGPYIHIGGDESHATKKEDYIEFVKKFHEIVQANKKIMVGWEEIAQGDIGKDVATQFWTSAKYGEMAIEKGSKLIMSPSKKVYLDMQYDSTTKLGLHWAAYIEVDSSYMWDPTTEFQGLAKDQILGVEAPLWSETIVTMDDIEYMLFPRLPGVAEIGWTAMSNRNWDTYKVRLGNQSKRWRAMGINFYRSPKVPWVD